MIGAYWKLVLPNKEVITLLTLHVLQMNEPMSEEIGIFEALDIFTQYKFGVLYVTPGQTDENDMFCNRKQRVYF